MVLQKNIKGIHFLENFFLRNLYLRMTTPVNASFANFFLQCTINNFGIFFCRLVLPFKKTLELFSLITVMCLTHFRPAPFL